MVAMDNMAFTHMLATELYDIDQLPLLAAGICQYSDMAS